MVGVRPLLLLALGAAAVLAVAPASVLADQAPAATGSKAEAPAASPKVIAPMPSPFGPGWDPTRPKPEEPKTAGAGIVSATLVAAGPADVEELRDGNAAGAAPFFGVVLDVRIAGGSTTALFDATSVVAQTMDATTRPLVAACTPTIDDPLAVWHALGIGLGAWNIAIDGRTWFCGGRTGRLAIRIGEGGFRVTIGPGNAWNGPLVLLFANTAERPSRVVLLGTTVAVPAPDDNTN